MYLIGIVIGVGDGVVVIAVTVPAATDTRNPPLQRLHINSFLFPAPIDQFPSQILTFHPSGLEIVSTLIHMLKRPKTLHFVHNFHPFQAILPNGGPINCTAASCYMHSPFISLTQPCRVSSVSHTATALNTSRLFQKWQWAQPSREFIFPAMTGLPSGPAVNCV